MGFIDEVNELIEKLNQWQGTALVFVEGPDKYYVQGIITGETEVGFKARKDEGGEKVILSILNKIYAEGMKQVQGDD